VHAPLQEESYDFRTWTSLQPPAGSYRRVLSAAAIRRAGADSAEARRNAGVTTLTFSGPRAARRFALEWRGAGVRPPCRGRVGLNARHIVLEWNPATPCHGFMVLSALTDGLGDLHVTVDRRSQPAWIRTAFAGTWRRVDCRPSVAPAVPAAKREQWRVGALHIRRAELPAVEGRIRAAQLLGVPGAAELADARGERVRLLRLAALLERNAKYIPLLGAPPPSDRERPC
jgi:hypothetical protein